MSMLNILNNKKVVIEFIDGNFLTGLFVSEGKDYIYIETQKGPEVIFKNHIKLVRLFLEKKEE